jgi:hypothetical protein
MPEEQTIPHDMPGIMPDITLAIIKAQLDTIEAKLDQLLGKQG